MILHILLAALLATWLTELVWLVEEWVAGGEK